MLQSRDFTTTGPLPQIRMSSAHALLEVTGQSHSFPINVERICQFLGIKIRLTPDEEEGHLAFLDGVATLCISNRVARVRRRFTMAQEIGYLILGLDRHNREDVYVANRFAAELLMPEDRVRIVAQALDTLADMARYFDVSTDAMIYRLRTLGIVD